MIKNEFKTALSFDDVMLVPKFSKLNSRKDADLSTTIAGVKLKIPIIAANMSSVCGAEMALALRKMGGLGIIHRMCSVEEQYQMVKTAALANWPGSAQFGVGFSIGLDDWEKRMICCINYSDIVCLDVAHGHHQRVLDLLEKYYKNYKNFPIIIGQIATEDAFFDILEVIPEKYLKTTAVKTSIGGGSICTTRIKTGFGIPTFQAVYDLKQNDVYNVYNSPNIIADGGIRNSGDIVKSLAAGANAVMLGNLLAGTDEAPGNIIKKDGKKYKIYRGSASYGDKADRGEATKNIEGEETLVPYRGPVKKVIESLLDGIRSGFSYGGALNILDLQFTAEFVKITQAGYLESTPHGVEGEIMFNSDDKDRLSEMLQQKIHNHLNTQICFAAALERDKTTVKGEIYSECMSNIIQASQKIADIFGIKLKTAAQILEEENQIKMLEYMFQLDPDKNAIRT